MSCLYSKEHIIRQGYVICIELFFISLVFTVRLEFFILISVLRHFRGRSCVKANNFIA